MKLTVLTSLLVAAATAGNPVLDGLLDFCEKTYETGREYSEAGLNRMADWFFGQSLCAVSSLNYAVREIYRDRSDREERAEITDDLENYDVDMSLLDGLFQLADALEAGADRFGEVVADIPGVNFRKNDEHWNYFRMGESLVSPYSDLFMGVVADYRGKAEEAKRYYTLALMNPYLDRSLCDFSFLADMSTDDLYDLSLELDMLDRKYRSAMTETSFYFSEPAPIHWDASVFRELARRELRKENHPNLRIAVRYCEAAIHVDPFDPVNYDILSRLYALQKNFRKMENIVNEGLALDPDNEFYNEIIRIYSKYE